MKKTFAVLMVMLMVLSCLSTAFAASDGTVHTHRWIVDPGPLPTCTSTGADYYYCPGCGASYEQVTGPLAHSYVKWERIQDPTADQFGLEFSVCEACGNYTTRAFNSETEAFSSPVGMGGTTGGQSDPAAEAAKPVEDIFPLPATAAPGEKLSPAVGLYADVNLSEAAPGDTVVFTLGILNTGDCDLYDLFLLADGNVTCQIPSLPEG